MSSTFSGRNWSSPAVLSLKTRGLEHFIKSYYFNFHSRSRLSGEVPKAVSNKLDFESFLKHYKSYDVAQTLFNKMVKIL